MRSGESAFGRSIAVAALALAAFGCQRVHRGGDTPPPILVPTPATLPASVPASAPAETVVEGNTSNLLQGGVVTYTDAQGEPPGGNLGTVEPTSLHYRVVLHRQGTVGITIAAGLCEGFGTVVVSGPGHYHLDLMEAQCMTPASEPPTPKPPAPHLP